MPQQEITFPREMRGEKPKGSAVQSTILQLIYSMHRSKHTPHNTRYYFLDELPTAVEFAGGV